MISFLHRHSCCILWQPHPFYYYYLWISKGICCIQTLLFCFQPRKGMVQPHALPATAAGWPPSGPGLGWHGWTSLWAQDCRTWHRQALHKSRLSWEVQTRDTEIKHLIDQHQRAVKGWTQNQKRELLDHIDSCSPSGHFCPVKVKVRKILTEHGDPLLEVLP